MISVDIAITAPFGNFIDKDGKVIGQHKGILNYTVGQRRGLGVAMGQRMFVSEIRPETNEIVLLPDGGSYAKSMTVTNLNFQLLPPPNNGERRNVSYPSRCIPQFPHYWVEGEAGNSDW